MIELDDVEIMLVIEGLWERSGYYRRCINSEHTNPEDKTAYQVKIDTMMALIARLLGR